MPENQSTPRPSASLLWLVPILFLGSGATALVYEVIWSKYLGLIFGSTIQAQTVVLAVFMGGLAVGNRLFGARAMRSPHPLALYGYVEGVIGLYAFFFHTLHGMADALFRRAGAPLLGSPLLLLTVKGLFSVGLLLGPTILMGGTLPLLAAWLQRSGDDASRRSARFYSINSLGAVLGAGLAGFILVRQLGLEASLQATALGNILIAFTAVGLAKRPATGTSAVPEVSHSTAAKSEEQHVSPVLLVMLTGAVSMGLEVLASRCLGLVFGSSLPAFALVLMAFILGIGLSSAVVASPRFPWQRPETVVPVLLLGAALWITCLVLAVEPLVQGYLVAKAGLARNEMGYAFHQGMIGAIALVVLGVPAGLLGAVLPVCLRGVETANDGLAREIGRLLTWNTLAAVVGVMLTGFVLMPVAGLRGALLLFAGGLCAAAFLVLRRGAMCWPRWLAVGGVVSVALVAGLTGDGWRHTLSSGIFRIRSYQPGLLEQRRKAIHILFYEDAPDATVSVEQGDGKVYTDQLSLRINGKVDASSSGDLNTQYLLAHLPLAARPESKRVFVLGFGSGITAGAVLGHPIDRITIAENCAPVLRAGKLFAPWNRNILESPRAAIFKEDARTVLKLDPEPYDVIISEPSNPWMVGVGSVFSREFYELAASRLKPGGIMTQWFHSYEMNDRIVDMILRTFSSVFPYLEIWDPGDGDLILLGSQAPWTSSPAQYQKIFDRPEVRHDLAQIGIETPAALWARQLASQRTGFAAPRFEAMQSDGFPVLEYDAPLAFYIGDSAHLLSEIDERTHQSALAAPEKAAALNSLTAPVLWGMFNRYGSVNPELSHRVREYYPAVLRGEVPALPLLTVLHPDELRMPATLTPAHRAVWEAYARLQQPGGNLAAVDALSAAYKQVQVEDSRREGWQPSVLLADAVRICFQRGDLRRAGQLLELRTLFPSEDLEYLARVQARATAAVR